MQSLMEYGLSDEEILCPAGDALFSEKYKHKHLEDEIARERAKWTGKGSKIVVAAEAADADAIPRIGGLPRQLIATGLGCCADARRKR